MSQSDPTVVLVEMKRTEALLRDARSVLRRVDGLAAKASTSDDPSRALIAEVRAAAEHLVSQLAIASKSNGAPPSRWRAACADRARYRARGLSARRAMRCL
ncbi:MAG: hypothetical protein ACLP50_03350 [Solirubrobacteraceae bacterium]